MIYRKFAIATLLIAPVIVMLAQNLTPHATPTPQPVNAVSVPVQAPTSVSASSPPATQPLDQSQYAPAAPTTEPVEFGKPMPDAGQPTLAPGSGLPDNSRPNL